MEEELRKKQEQDEAQVEYGSEERGPVLPSGRTGGRRGETARQLIRRAKQASRRRFPAEEKIRIVMEGIRAAGPEALQPDEAREETRSDRVGAAVASDQERDAVGVGSAGLHVLPLAASASKRGRRGPGGPATASRNDLEPAAAGGDGKDFDGGTSRTGQESARNRLLD